MVSKQVLEDGLEAGTQMVSCSSIITTIFTINICTISVYFQDDVSDYIDYINNHLKSVHIGDKASPAHQQVSPHQQSQRKLNGTFKSYCCYFFRLIIGLAAVASVTATIC